MSRARSYIVRVYARLPGNRLEGVVEDVANAAHLPFATAEELWAIVRPKRVTSRQRAVNAGTPQRDPTHR